MNWWKRFKVDKQLSDDEKIAFLSYLRLDQTLAIEIHPNSATNFPSISFAIKQDLIEKYIPSEKWLQWAGFYLIQCSNRFGYDTSIQHTFDIEMLNEGGKFSEILVQFAPQNCLCIADFPTLQLFSFAIGAKSVCEPIFNYDTIPHPLGISSAKTALELLFQCKNEFDSEQMRKYPLLLLDSNRLVSYTDNPSQFDNRSTAKLPTIESLKQRNINTIIYCSNSEMDLDDVHEDFCYYVNAGLSLLWYNTQNGNEIKEKLFVKRSTMFSKRTSFINKV